MRKHIAESVEAGDGDSDSSKDDAGTTRRATAWIAISIGHAASIVSSRSSIAPS